MTSFGGVENQREGSTADGATVWQTARTYEGTGRVTAGTQEALTYRADSTVATHTTRDGITLTYAYDAANRPLGVTPPAARVRRASTRAMRLCGMHCRGPNA